MTTVYIDFKKELTDESAAPWSTNLVTPSEIDGANFPLVDENDNATGYSLIASSGLGVASKVGGATVITNNSGLPDDVARTYIASTINNNLVLTISGLDPNQSFTIDLLCYAYANDRHTDATINGSEVQRYLVSQSEIVTPLTFSGSATPSGEVVITLGYVVYYAHLGAIKLVTEDSQDTVTTTETECSFGSEINISTTIANITSATLQDSYGNVMSLNVVSDSQLTVPALAHGVDGILLEDSAAITVSDGSTSASTSINFVPPTGYELTTLTSIVDRDLIESDWVYPLAETAGIGDQSLKLVADSFVTHNADGSSTITNSGTYTYYAIDTKDGGVTEIETSIAASTTLPIVSAGSNLTAVNGETVLLSDAMASNYDSLSWSCVTGQSPTFSNATSINPNVTFNEPGTHLLRLTATNTAGSSSDTLTATINAVDGNLPPTANAGPDQSVAAGVRVQLNALMSSDPEDGAISQFGWEQVDNGADTVVLEFANTATPEFTAPSSLTAQTLEFRVQAQDSEGATSTDTVTVTVAALEENAILSIMETLDFELATQGNIVAYKGRSNREVMQLKPSSSTGIVTDGGYLDLSNNGIRKVEIIADGKKISNENSDSIKIDGTRILARLGDLDIPTGGRDSITPTFMVVLYVGSDTRGLVVASNATAGYKPLSYRVEDAA